MHSIPPKPQSLQQKHEKSLATAMESLDVAETLLFDALKAASDAEKFYDRAWSLYMAAVAMKKQREGR